jgi:outer membrane protein OmpA-like peptidoglycan-associated protein
VTQPSDVVVAENFIRTDTTGTMEHVDAKYELLQRGQYVLNRSQYKPPRFDPKGPLQLAEAENAVEIARLAGAQKYAGDTFQKALVDLRNAEDFLSGKSKDRKAAETNAREAAQMAEDARIITFRKMRQEQLDAERAASEKREADAQEHARQEALKAQQANEQARLDQQRRAEAESQQRAAEQARMQAEQAKADADRARMAAEQAAAQAAQEKAAADAAKADALRQQQALAAEADRARQDANKAESEKTELREKLRQQLNMILETRESARGLIVNISDVLFDFNKYTLKPGAREKLAKVSGILLAYPGLKIQVEGHTDAIGSDVYNQTLSEQRAGAVRDYITTQGVPGNMVSAVGFGKQNPVASNDTDAGRQQNRRVELVVSGEAIGIGSLQ